MRCQVNGGGCRSGRVPVRGGGASRQVNHAAESRMAAPAPSQTVNRRDAPGEARAAVGATACGTGDTGRGSLR